MSTVWIEECVSTVVVAVVDDVVVAALILHGTLNKGCGHACYCCCCQGCGGGRVCCGGNRQGFSDHGLDTRAVRVVVAVVVVVVVVIAIGQGTGGGEPPLFLLSVRRSGESIERVVLTRMMMMMCR